jgi:signal transduction histidine kinase
MRERLALLGGRLQVESGGGGTTIVVEVPIR